MNKMKIFDDFMNDLYYAQHDSTHMCVGMGGNTHADDRMKQIDYSLRREENRRTQQKRNKRDNENRITSWLEASNGGKTEVTKNSDVASSYYRITQEQSFKRV